MKMISNYNNRQSIWDTFSIRVTGFTPHSNNTLHGYVTVEIEDLDIEISNIGIHKKGASEWITLPSIPQIKDDGSRNWFQTMGFFDKRDFQAFEKKVLEAHKRFINPKASKGDSKATNITESDKGTEVGEKYYPQDEWVADVD
jgi:hypothetical protein